MRSASGEIVTFYKARWHKRMWVAVELAHSMTACIITQDYLVFKEDRYMSDSFFFFLEYFKNAMRHIGQQIGGARFLELFLELHLHAAKLTCIRKQDKLNFGEVFSLVAGKECRDYRDRHLAIASFLGLAIYDKLCEQFRDKTSDEVCQWVWKTALEKGDCTPLLIIQSPTSKLKYPHPAWIADGREMKPWMWDLGSLMHPPKITICESAVGQLRLKMEYVGSFTYLPFSRAAISTLEVLEEFLHTIRVVISSPACLIVERFVRAMKRIYPLFGVRNADSLPATLRGYIESNPDFVSTLEALLTKSKNLRDDDRILMQNIQDIISLLCLEILSRA
jgi:hypothetical protein